MNQDSLVSKIPGKASPSDALHDNRVELIHSGIIEFVATRSPQKHGLYAILNQLALLVQKPLLFVLFTKPLSEISLKKGKDCGWAHSMVYPASLRDKFDVSIEEHLEKIQNSKEKSLEEIQHIKDLWLLDTLDFSTSFSAIGFFYIDISLEQDLSCEYINKKISISNTCIQYLCKKDMENMHKLFSSIRNYRSTRNEKGVHLYYLNRYLSFSTEENIHFFNDSDVNYWKSLRWGGNEIRFQMAPGESEVDNLSIQLAPVIDEIDRAYCDLRSGTPGRIDSAIGASLVWARNRESLNDKTGIRPPTMAFYLKLRAPGAPKKTSVGLSDIYRIVPIVTISMARDQAACIVDYLEREGQSEISKEGVIEYFIEHLNMDWLERSDIDRVLNKKDKTEKIYALAEFTLEGTRVKRFLGQEAFSSFAYLAMSSGIAMTVDAAPCSLADRVTSGPEFLSEPQVGRKGIDDSAYVHPIMVGGFPLIGLVTKTRTPMKNESESSFGTFHYTYIFVMGVVRRMMARRIRSAMYRVYLELIEGIFYARLSKMEITATPDNSLIATIDPSWFSDVNRCLDEIGQTYPFGILQIERLPYSVEKYDNVTDSREFKLLDTRLCVYTKRNSFYHHKLVEQTGHFVNIDTVHRTIERAISRLEVLWADRASDALKRQAENESDSIT